jgi:hypothetical protein
MIRVYVALLALLILIATTACSVASSVAHNVAWDTPQIEIDNLPSGTVRVPYDVTVNVKGGTTPYSWRSVSDSLPAGLALGTLAGAPTASGQSSFTVVGNDSFSPSQTATQAPTLTIGSASDVSRSAIPSSLFGMAVTSKRDWPTVPFGELGKATEVGWPYIEQTQGVYVWTNLDRWVSIANAHNTPLNWALQYAPPWAVTDRSSCSTLALAGIKGCSADVTNLTDMNAFFTALTQRYNGKNGHGFIAVYELYNEPENFFKGDTANLVAQTVALYKAVQANSPNSLVAGMGVDYPDAYYAPGKYMDTYWAAGGVKTLSAVCFHGYPHHSSDVPEIVNTFVPYVTAAMARNGIPATPIWDTEGSWGNVTEAGWNITDPGQQAAWVARSYLLHWSDGVSRFDWYGWDAYPWGALWTSSSEINEAGLAYGQVYTWMVGATMSAPCSVSGTVWTCGLTKPGGTGTLAVWNTSGSSSYTPGAEYKHYRDLSGNTSLITGGSVTIGIKPILLD